MNKTVALAVFCLFAFALTTNAFMGFTKSGSRLHGEPWKPEVFNRADEVIEDFVVQRLDNFDPQNNATYEMVCVLTLFSIYEYIRETAFILSLFADLSVLASLALLSK